MFKLFCIQNKKIFYETNDFNTENTNDTWVPVINQGVLQHRVIPRSLIKQGDTWSNFTQADSLNIGFDSSSQNFIIQINFPDRTISRISYNKNNILNDYFNGASWERIWEK